MLARNYVDTLNINMSRKSRCEWKPDATIKCERAIDDEDEKLNHFNYHREMGYEFFAHDFDSIGACDGLCGFSYDTKPYVRYLSNKFEDMTTFSLNKALFLGGLSCIGIYAEHLTEQDAHVGCSAVETEMQIVEFSNLAAVNRSTLLKMKIDMKVGGAATFISLPHSILVRPGYFYTIRFGPFDDKDFVLYCYDRDRINIVPLKSNIVVKFHKKHDASLVQLLNFNQI